MMDYSIVIIYVHTVLCMHALYTSSGSLVKLSLDKTTVVLDELLESVHVTGTLQ